ncbi:MAG: GNAT family N-acetyltransferase [Rhodospirillales bacterium]
MSWRRRFAIEPLSKHHDRAGFRCGTTALDDYIAKQASQDVRRHISQVFVAIESGREEIFGYYTLCAGSVDQMALPQEIARRLPRYPVPVAMLGRLAVATAHQGSGLGKVLVADACKRVLQASGDVAMMAVVGDAKDAAARRFYERFGFTLLPDSNRRMFLPMASLRAIVDGD